MTTELDRAVAAAVPLLAPGERVLAAVSGQSTRRHPLGPVLLTAAAWLCFIAVAGRAGLWAGLLGCIATLVSICIVVDATWAPRLVLVTDRGVVAVESDLSGRPTAVVGRLPHGATLVQRGRGTIFHRAELGPGHIWLDGTSVGAPVETFNRWSAWHASSAHPTAI